MFMMSFFEIPEGVLKNLDPFISRFFWQGSNKNTNTGLSDGTSCAGPRIRVASGSWIYNFKTNVFWLNG
jgi:hypothetical protein